MVPNHFDDEPDRPGVADTLARVCEGPRWTFTARTTNPRTDHSSRDRSVLRNHRVLDPIAVSGSLLPFGGPSRPGKGDMGQPWTAFISSEGGLPPSGSPICWKTSRTLMCSSPLLNLVANSGTAPDGPAARCGRCSTRLGQRLAEICDCRFDADGSACLAGPARQCCRAGAERGLAFAGTP